MLCFLPNRRPDLVDDGPPPRRHLLIAAGAADLLEVSRVLAVAPVDVRGFVALESDGPIPAQPMTAPEGVAVRWFRREGAAGAACVRAADAWLDEWMRADEDPRAEYAIWIGCEGSELVGGFVRAIGLELAANRAGEA